MVSGYIIIIVLVILSYYVATKENTRLETTSSAIRQVWSGGCQQSLEGSQVSGLSSLHSMPPCQRGTTIGHCVCDTCPCSMIQNILRPFSPVSAIYSDVTRIVLHYYNNALNTVVEAYRYVSRVAECGTSCQAQAKVPLAMTKQYAKDDQNEDKIGECSKSTPKFRPAVEHNNAALPAKKSTISFKEPVISDSSRDEHDFSGGKASGKSTGSDVTLTGNNSSCPGCAHVGKTCISECPNTKKRK